MQMSVPRGRVAYEPSTLESDSAREVFSTGFQSAEISECGDKGRLRASSFADHYSQARLFYLSQTDYEQAHIASALVFELSKVEHLHVRQAMVGHLRHIDEELARRVADGLGFMELPVPPLAEPVRDYAPSPALQIIGKMKRSLEGRCVGMLVASGSDAAAVDALSLAVREAGASIRIVAVTVGLVPLSNDFLLKVDGQLAGTPSAIFDAVAIVLAEDAAERLAQDVAALDFVRDAMAHLKALAVDGGGLRLLRMAGVELDAGVVAIDNIPGFIAMAKTRQWAREKTLRFLA
ncbi:catalase-related domain-containing protein [Chromobacterium vaccinii]|uniref:catalase-related domain-containing protein n=1 Tax=Chromobacterium vaccinii TaxID=1108595 RepID=UPI0036F3C722